MAADGEKLLNEVFLLLQPQLLNDSTLVNILKSRCVRQHGLSLMRREQLVQLFYSVAVPLPQRKYRDNRRGRALTKARDRVLQASGGSRADESPPQSVRTPYSGSGDRLKPPPSCSDVQRRKIRPRGDGSPAGHRKRPRVEAATAVCVGKEPVPGQRSVQLKRSRSEMSDSATKVSGSSSVVEETLAHQHYDCSSKQRRKITWP